MLVQRFKTPPRITRWSIKGKYVRKAWNSLKTGFSYLVCGTIVTAFSYTLPDAYGEKSLYAKFYDESLEVVDVEKYLDRGADINYRDEYGTPILTKAIHWDEMEIAKELINHGADVNLADFEGDTPLSSAIYSEDESMVSALLDAGANVSVDYDLLSSSISSKMSASIIARMLGDNRLQLNPDEESSLIEACIYSECETDIIKLLVDRGFSKTVTIEDESIAKYARDNQREDIALLFDQTDALLRAGEDLTNKTSTFIE